ncbi:LPD29 domain-containing protein [Streptomyces sp. NPDC055912]|uniref:LPD29 domain-containing protein n=1 Tax=Streptomyces sp. NPDC055912 TaxID=3345660 RepID=UPI0035E3024B
MHALITLDTDGHVSIPGRAARYTLESKGSHESDTWEILEQITLPDGTLAGSTSELLAGLMLTDIEGIAVLEDGVLTVSETGRAFRFSPAEEWEALTPAHTMAARYTVEGTHPGRGTWSTKNVQKTEVTAAEVRSLTEQSTGGDVAVHGSGVIIVEAARVGFALRLTPVPEPTFRQEQWDSRKVAKYLRTELRRTFPGQTFSVRCGRGSDADYLSIAWTGGPSRAEVEALCDPWQGADFDGMADGMNQREPLLIVGAGGALVEVRPLTDLFDYTRSRPDGVLEQAKALISQETSAGWDAHFNNPRTFTFQGETFSGITGWERLNKVMDAIEGGRIAVS